MLELCETITGYYVYHLRNKGKFKSLCGKDVMSTGIPMSAWGVKTHLNEKWCPECKSLEADYFDDKRGCVCRKCDVEMDAVGLGDCNGWKCPKCGHEHVDVLSCSSD